MGTILLSVLVIVAGYLSGSLCSAIIVSRLFSLPDPCSEGSKNPGATNVLRLAGKKYAALVLLGDMLKGVLPVLLARVLELPDVIVGFTCLAAVVGHMYPVFFGFKGGKGVATAFGAFLALHFLMGIVLIATWLLIANISRYSSLASIITITLAPLYAIVSTGNMACFPALIIITVLVLYQHRNNVVRLIDGQEPELRLRHKQLSDLTDDILKKSIADDMEPSDTIQVECDIPVAAQSEPLPAAKPAAPKRTRKKKELPAE